MAILGIFEHISTDKTRALLQEITFQGAIIEHLKAISKFGTVIADIGSNS